MTQITFSCYVNITFFQNLSRIFDYGEQFQVCLLTSNKTSYTLNGYEVPLSSTFYKAWRNIAFTVDGTTLVPYDNGVRQKAITMAVALSTIDIKRRRGLIFGSHGNNELTNGCISDYRIYGRVLTDAEMLDLYTNRAMSPAVKAASAVRSAGWVSVRCSNLRKSPRR
jgi:Concanavalin A-like lectin/glucanases superfamily